jgi:mono/diheme cytochrome c family protein
LSSTLRILASKEKIYGESITNFMGKAEKTSDQRKESIFVRAAWLSPLFCVYFLTALITLGLLYVHRENMVNRNSVWPDVVVDSIYNRPAKESLPEEGNAVEEVDLATLLNPTKAQIARGGLLFKINCSSCHGTEGKGDGPASSNLNPKPRDFHSETGWVNGRKLSQMFKTVSEGIPGSAMVSFAGTLSPDDRIAVIDYIRSLSANFPKDSPQDIKAMGKSYHLNEGWNTFTRIPPEEAMKQIEEGAIPVARRVAVLASQIYWDRGERGAALFGNVVSDGRRALTALAMSDFWSKNESDFVRTVTANTVQNGFNPRVAQLSTQDWRTLYLYLRDLFSKQDIANKNG